MNSELPSKHVFCSYSHRDTQMMNRIRHALEKMGIIVWTDEGLTPGTESWKTTIETKIRNATGIVAILSPSANQSMWVERELEYASIHKIKIFPVLVEGEPADAIPIELINSQWIDVTNDANFSEQVHKLGLTIRAETASTSDIPKNPTPRNPSIRSRPAKSNANLKVLSAVIIGVCMVLVTMLTFSYGAKFMEYVRGATATPTNQPTQVAVAPPAVPTQQLEAQFDPNDPEGFLRWYFHEIWATRNYDYLWDYISDDFRHRLDQEFSTYETNWNAIGSIEEPIDITYEGKDGVLLKYRVQYTTLSRQNGFTDDRRDLYLLYFNSSKGHWEFK